MFMTFAHYNYIPTVTGPGHASFLSGSTPLMHGIIANNWYDRKTGQEVYCVDDQSVDGVGATPGKARCSRAISWAIPLPTNCGCALAPKWCRSQ